MNVHYFWSALSAFNDSVLSDVIKRYAMGALNYNNVFNNPFVSIAILPVFNCVDNSTYLQLRLIVGEVLSRFLRHYFFIFWFS